MCVLLFLKGVIDLEIWISGPKRDLHAGVDGGAVHEPLTDLMSVLSSLKTNDDRIAVEGLLEGVRTLTQTT